MTNVERVEKAMRKCGVKITSLPSSVKTKRLIRNYVINRHKNGVYPTMEQIRKGIYSPTTGWSIPTLRKWVLEAKFDIVGKFVMPVKNVATLSH